MAGTICWSTNFHCYSSKKSLRKDNSVVKNLTTELQKDKSNPEIVSGYFLAIEI